MHKMTLKGIIDEDFVNYRVPSMTLEFPYCDFKCGKEFCQNSPLLNDPNIYIDVNTLCERYLANPITEAVVFQGMEPFWSMKDVMDFIATLRKDYECNDDIVIYTGFDKDEIPEVIKWLEQFPNIIVKFGRFRPNHEPHYDEVLGVNLVSSNQYAERIS